MGSACGVLITSGRPESNALAARGARPTASNAPRSLVVVSYSTRTAPPRLSPGNVDVSGHGVGSLKQGNSASAAW